MKSGFLRKDSLLRKIGKFKISLEAIESTPDKVAELLSEMIVLEAKYLDDEEAIEYTAISDAFEEAPLGRYPPEYSLARRQDGTYEILDIA